MWLKNGEDKDEGEMWVKREIEKNRLVQDRCFYFLKIGKYFPLFETVIHVFQQSILGPKSDVESTTTF